MSFRPVSVLSVEKHNDRLLYLTLEKPANLSFESGQFIRIGLALKDNPQTEDDFLVRPYSIASRKESPKLEFYIARVINGELSGQLFDLKEGDTVWVDEQAYGFMLPERLKAGGHLICFGTGTGVSGFLSVIRANAWKRFDRVTVIHCARTADDLTVTDKFMEAAQHQDQLDHFRFIRVTTQETNADKMGEVNERIPTAIEKGTLEALGVALNPDEARVMLCGNPQFVTTMKKVLKDKGFTAPRGETLGTLVSENFW